MWLRPNFWAYVGLAPRREALLARAEFALTNLLSRKCWPPHVSALSRATSCGPRSRDLWALRNDASTRAGQVHRLLFWFTDTRGNDRTLAHSWCFTGHRVC